MSIFYEYRNLDFDCYTWENPNYPPHIHEHIEFVYILKGEVQLTINKITYFLGTHNCGLVYPDQIHSFKSDEAAEVLLVNADIHKMRELFNETITNRLLSPIFSQNDLSNTGLAAIELFKSRSNQSKAGFTNTDKGLVLMLMDDILGSLPTQSYTGITDYTIAQKALSYINENLNEDLTIETTAAKIGISKFYLSRIFSKEFHMTFPEYVTSRKLLLAIEFLNNKDMSIAEVAFEAGFANIRTFNRNFQKVYHISPTEWRKNAKKRQQASSHIN